MSEDESVFWLNVYLNETGLDAAFIESLNSNTRRIVDPSQSVPESGGKKVGVRIVCKRPPNEQTIDRLSFIKSGFQHQGIPISFAVQSQASFEELNIPESELFNDLRNRFPIEREE